MLQTPPAPRRRSEEAEAVTGWLVPPGGSVPLLSPHSQGVVKERRCFQGFGDVGALVLSNAAGRCANVSRHASRVPPRHSGPPLPCQGRETGAILKPNIPSWFSALPPPEFRYDAGVGLLPTII